MNLKNINPYYDKLIKGAIVGKFFKYTDKIIPKHNSNEVERIKLERKFINH